MGGAAQGAGASAAAPPAASSAGAAAASLTPVQPEVDESRPTTKLQLRLADGTRIAGIFNHDATIADLRRFVDA
jgi:UBX domain-containing protein 1